MLINNAAVMANELTRVGPGWESQFAIDHLGHFALTNRLWPALTRDGGARVVSVSSRGHKFSGIRWDDLQWEHGYDKWQAYGQAKTANVLFAVALDVRGKDAGVHAFAVYPAGVRTPLRRHLTHQEMRDLGWYDDQGNLAPLFKTPEQGAAGEAWAATSPQLDGMGGVYIERCDIAEIADPATDKGGREGANPDAVDPGQADRLWAVSAQPAVIVGRYRDVLAANTLAQVLNPGSSRGATFSATCSWTRKSASSTWTGKRLPRALSQDCAPRPGPSPTI